MVIANNNVTSFKWKTDGVSGRMYFQRNRKAMVDGSMKKYNEDVVNYGNSKWRVFKVGTICTSEV